MKPNLTEFPPNPDLPIQSHIEIAQQLKGQWPLKNTAILIAHGIGNQKPLETIDVFARGVVDSLIIYGGHALKIKMSHQLVAKQGDNQSYYWFDNFIRIKHDEYTSHIDIYEYYWANRTEDKTNLGKIITWLRKVTLGARHFYENNKKLITGTNDKSIFKNNKGSFNFVRYFAIIYLLGSFGAIVSMLIKGILAFVRVLPFGQYIADSMAEKLAGSASDTANIIGDIAIYNEVNPRSDLCAIRKEILNGAVKAIRFLVEPTDEELTKIAYDRVVVAGHSLGSQVSFDAINRLTHQINLGELKGYDKEGYRINKVGQKVLSNGQHLHISQLLDRYFTFGSPLDKVAFFLREQCKKEEYIRIQMLQNFHCFKQRKWDEDAEKRHPLDTTIVRQFDSILWRNYHHKRDYVSGSLDYYHSLTNVNCDFPSGFFNFTHSNYWYSSQFFGDILIHII